MYCPQCSQEQISDEVRFCPRCGFQLDALKTLLAENQNGLAMSEIETETQLVSTRKRDVLLGATVMLVAAISIVLLMISGVAVTPWQAVIIPLLLVWTAIVSVILLSGHAAREVTNLFSKDASASPSQVASNLLSRLSPATRHPSLPPAQSTSVSGFGLWRVNTAELAQSPSITEHTTNSLNKKD
jgi:Na+(H+)/acetate symporter ActP